MQVVTLNFANQLAKTFFIIFHNRQYHDQFYFNVKIHVFEKKSAKNLHVNVAGSL